MNALAYAMQAINGMVQLMAAGKSIMQFVTETNSALTTMKSENRDPTTAEWDELNVRIDALHRQAQS